MDSDKNFEADRGGSNNDNEEFRMYTKLVGAVVIILALVLGFLSGCSRQLTTDDVCEKLEQYTKSVYAPKSMEEFEEAKEEAVDLGIMTETVANTFFASYGDTLTEADLARSCFATASYGDKSLQSDGVSKYLVSASLYSVPGENPIKITIMFTVTNSGVINNYSLVTGV